MAVVGHICERVVWEAAVRNGIYEPHSLHQEGFIHCSLPSQITEVADTFYRAHRDLLLLWIELDDVSAEIRWEEPPSPVKTQADPNTPETFPHIYGPLNVDAVIQVFEFSPGEDGKFRLPDL